MRSQTRPPVRSFDEPIGVDVAAVRRGLGEPLFLGFAFLVLQGALGISFGGGEEDGGSETRHMLGFALVLLGTAIFGARHRRAIVSGALGNLVFWLLPVVIVASTLWSLQPLLTLKRSVLTSAICVFDLYVAVAFGLDRLIKLTSRTILITAIASLVASILLPSIGRDIAGGMAEDWRGIFSQKNVLGHVMSIGSSVELFIMIRARRLQLGTLFRFFLCFVLVAKSHSASSLLSVLLSLGLAAFYVSFRRGAASGLVCLLLGCSALSLFGGVVGVMPDGIFSMVDRDPTLTGRTDLWFYVMNFIRERPIGGWGYQAFWTPDAPNAVYIRRMIEWNAPNAHNGYLELALGVGMLGVGACLLMGAWALRRAIIALSWANDLGAMFLIIVVQLLVSNLTESFMIDAGIFGWNIFTILLLKIGVEMQGRRTETESWTRSILDRAKASQAY